MAQNWKPNPISPGGPAMMETGQQGHPQQPFQQRPVPPALQHNGNQIPRGPISPNLPPSGRVVPNPAQHEYSAASSSNYTTTTEGDISDNKANVFNKFRQMDQQNAKGQQKGPAPLSKPDILRGQTPSSPVNNTKTAQNDIPARPIQKAPSDLKLQSTPAGSPGAAATSSSNTPVNAEVEAPSFKASFAKFGVKPNETHGKQQHPAESVAASDAGVAAVHAAPRPVAPKPQPLVQNAALPVSPAPAASQEKLVSNLSGTTPAKAEAPIGQADVVAQPDQNQYQEQQQIENYNQDHQQPAENVDQQAAGQQQDQYQYDQQNYQYDQQNYQYDHQNYQYDQQNYQYDQQDYQYDQQNYQYDQQQYQYDQQGYYDQANQEGQGEQAQADPAQGQDYGASQQDQQYQQPEQDQAQQPEAEAQKSEEVPKRAMDIKQNLSGIIAKAAAGNIPHYAHANPESAENAGSSPLSKSPKRGVLDGRNNDLLAKVLTGARPISPTKSHEDRQSPEFLEKVLNPSGEFHQQEQESAPKPEGKKFMKRGNNDLLAKVLMGTPNSEIVSPVARLHSPSRAGSAPNKPSELQSTGSSSQILSAPSPSTSAAATPPQNNTPSSVHLSPTVEQSHVQQQQQTPQQTPSSPQVQPPAQPQQAQAQAQPQPQVEHSEHQPIQGHMNPMNQMNQMNMMGQMNPMNAMNPMNQRNPMSPMNQMNFINPMNQMQLQHGLSQEQLVAIYQQQMMQQQMMMQQQQQQMAQEKKKKKKFFFF